MSNPQPRRKRLEIEDIGDVTVVTFTDRKLLDEQSIQLIGEQLFALPDELGRKKILLDFRNVEYCSSASLAKFLALERKVGDLGQPLVLCNVDRGFREVLEITRFDKHFTVCGDLQDGMAVFQKKEG